MNENMTYRADGRGGWVGSTTHGPAAAPDQPETELYNHWCCKGCDGSKPLTLGDREIITGRAIQWHDEKGAAFCGDCLADLPDGVEALAHVCGEELTQNDAAAKTAVPDISTACVECGFDRRNPIHCDDDETCEVHGDVLTPEGHTMICATCCAMQDAEEAAPQLTAVLRQHLAAEAIVRGTR